MRRGPRPDPVLLVAGVGLLAMGALVALDGLGMLDLRFAVLAPVACALVGAVLLAGGLSDG